MSSDVGHGNDCAAPPGSCRKPPTLAYDSSGKGQAALGARFREKLAEIPEFSGFWSRLRENSDERRADFVNVIALFIAPASAKTDVLEPTALFKKLSGSVFQLEATRERGTAQGSAVAISATELLTNCHVVQGALKLALKQSKKAWPARVTRADPATDRCIISATGAVLQPVMGVRSYESLAVGEAAYTLGSPVGLELTLSNGIVSGRRDEQGHHYVQTTAPISPGSSGGGLFDGRGNLIGITTSVLVGREHLNQSLNFAIPADAFWQP
jgi:S1-C subfamily serine protease